MNYYKTLAERSASIDVPNHTIDLDDELVVLLNGLIPNRNVIVDIPRWKNDEDAVPYVVYRFSRSTKFTNKETLFFPPYDPILISADNKILAVIYSYQYYSRDIDVSTFIIEQLNQIKINPVQYFSTIGNRWGKCLLCGRTLKVEKSLDRAIGPVCYGRLKNIGVKIVPEGSYNVDIGSAEQKRHVTILTDNSLEGLLNDIEREGLLNFNTMLSQYYDAGLTIKLSGFVTFHRQVKAIPVFKREYYGIRKVLMVSVKPQKPSYYSHLTKVMQKYSYDPKHDSWVLTQKQYIKLVQDGILKEVEEEKEWWRSERKGGDDLSALEQQMSALDIKSPQIELKQTISPIELKQTILPPVETNKPSEVIKQGDIEVSEKDNKLYVKNFPYMQRELIKQLPNVKWAPEFKSWSMPTQNKAELDLLISKLNK